MVSWLSKRGKLWSVFYSNLDFFLDFKISLTLVKLPCCFGSFHGIFTKNIITDSSALRLVGCFISFVVFLHGFPLALVAMLAFFAFSAGCINIRLQYTCFDHFPVTFDVRGGLFLNSFITIIMSLNSLK